VDYLNSILTSDQIDDIIDTFEESVLLKLNGENIQRIVSYLKKEKIYFIEDIILQYVDLFVLPFEEFIEKFEKLKEKYSANFVEYLAYHLNILEEMYDM